MGDGLAPAFVELLADPRIALRRPPPDLPVAVIRAAANRFMARGVGPSIYAATDLFAVGVAGPLRLRLYRPSDAIGLPVVLFCHGGGFVYGDLDTHDGMCRRLALAADAAVLAVDYRLAPEHPFPAALDDCSAALTWIAANAATLRLDIDRLAIAGDSAGGQLAIATTLRTAQTGLRIAHVGLLYPLLDPRFDSASARVFGQDYMLTASFVEWAWEAYRGAAAAGDPHYDLILAAFEGFPPTTIATAALDPLRDEGEALAARMIEAGVPIALRCYPGMIHGFAGMPQLTPVASEAIDFVGRRIAASFSDRARVFPGKTT